jgi:transmembrane 9 superfamily member 2/4
MKAPKTCEVACMKSKISKASAETFIKAIDEDYRVHWILDNLPVGTFRSSDQVFERGFPVGFSIRDGKTIRRYINNHIRIVIQYHDDTITSFDEMDLNKGPSKAKIIGFQVVPYSIHHKWSDDTFVKGITIMSTCDPSQPISQQLQETDHQEVVKGQDIVFTYDVIFEPTPQEWTNRWDRYVLQTNSQDTVHWYAITNSIMIVLFLTVMIALILIRTLRKDIANYNTKKQQQQLSDFDDEKDESGWKMVHGDVFRPPSTLPMLLSVFVGTGVQLIAMSIATLSFTLLGLLSPQNRGSLTTAFIFLYVFMGSFAGYHSSSIYKMFRGTEWQRTTILTALFFPGTIFVIYFTLNVALLLEGSSGAIPFTTFFTLLFLWFCVSVPLVFIGSYYGYKTEIPTFPVRINQIPRLIPTQKWYLHPFITISLGGILPFGAVSVELFFILSALWLHQIYYIFGFLFLVMIVLIVTCAEISILFCYFHLCAEDYHWWWRSFLTAGSCAGYTLLYSIWYYLAQLEMDGFLPTLIYFSYMITFSLLFFLVAGTIGFYSCYWFNMKIYGSLKVD